MASRKPLSFNGVTATLKRTFESLGTGPSKEREHGMQVKEEPLYVTKVTDRQEVRYWVKIR